MKSTSAGPTLPFRDVVLGALIPAFIFSTGIGALLPIIAPYSVERGATLATAGVVAAMLPVGQILADLPAGQLAAKIGDRAAMLAAGLVAALGFLLAAVAPSVITLAGAVLLVGASNAVFHLARHSYLTDVTPARNRATVLSTLGGVHRIGQFVGPFLGAGVIYFFDMGAVFFLAVATALAATVTVWLARPTKRATADAAPVSIGEELTKPRFWRVLSDHRRMLVTLGSVGMMVGAIRGARQQIIPLWGEYIELDPTTISLLFGLAGGIDMLLFYPAGRVMDKLGRLWVGVPAMTILGVAMALFPLTSTATGLALVSMLLGFANGLGSGIMMTISSDISPPEARPQFLGAWRLLTDSGLGSGPLILAAGAAAGSLAAGIWVASAVGPLAAMGMQRWLPRYSDHANRTTRRRAGLID
ncbi:MFS transporter [Nesterenkonia salmonea]|uniref:MFS transporter n=1 Tax=Nesterenkonia salmonea TaxID=1804987 RepID=UPI001FB80059|nr:MFS transporter [Nesterenkonia salmonea]